MDQMDKQNHVDKFGQFLSNAQNIVITTHIIPDADGIGGMLALRMALEEIGKHVQCVIEKPLNQRFFYLDPLQSIQSFAAYKQNTANPNIDLFIVVDANNHERIGSEIRRLLKTSKKFVFIDHHPAPLATRAIHCIDTKRAATGELIYHLILGLNVKINPQMAAALYAAVLIDTSCFRYPTVTSETHQMVAHLIKIGVNPSKTYNQIYGDKDLSHLKLLGEILTHAEISKEKDLGWISISEELLTKYQVSAEDTHHLVNHLLILKNIKVVCMFRSFGKKVKISIRTNLPELIDVGEMAKALGGGGHNHAAATVIEGPLKDVIRDTTSKIQLILNHYDHLDHLEK